MENARYAIDPQRCVIQSHHPTLACATVRCRRDYECVMEDGRPRCKPKSSGGLSTILGLLLFLNESHLACATVKCRGGYECVIENGGPRCKPLLATAPVLSNAD